MLVTEGPQNRLNAEEYPRRNSMHMQEIRSKAKDFGIKSANQSKVDLVRRIQQAEGNFTCFATAVSGECDQLGCLWREDCFAAARKSAH
jgi:exonuclease III